MKLHESTTNWKAIQSFSTLEKRFNNLHNNKYDYSKAVYTKSRGKLIIICPKHGEFTKTPDAHLDGQGCPKCSQIVSSNKLRFTKNDFILKAKKVHGDKYDYSKVIYKQNKEKVIIICPIHGEFKQTPHNHITLKTGCKLCSFNSITSTKQEFITKANKVHQNLYTYDKVYYVNNITKVIITCPIHGDWEQTPGNHLSGKGCRKCRSHGFDQNKPGILYYIKLKHNNNTFYKIGITNKKVEERFGKEMNFIEIIFTVFYDIGKHAYTIEQMLLNKFKHLKYIGEPILKSGNSEILTEDIGYNQKNMITLSNNAPLTEINEALVKLRN